MAMTPVSALTGPTIERVLGRGSVGNPNQARQLQSVAQPGGYGATGAALGAAAGRAGATSGAGSATSGTRGAGGGSGAAVGQPGGSNAGGGERADASGGLAELSMDAIRANIAALEAQYGMTIDEIIAAGGAAAADAQFMLGQLAKQEQRQTEQLIGSMVTRGLLRSGITAQNLARQQGDFADVRARQQEVLGREQQGLERQGASANANLQAGIANLISMINDANLDPELARAMLGEVEGLQISDIEAALAGAFGNRPKA